MPDCTETLQDRVADAVARASPLRIRGGDSKYFYGNQYDYGECEVLEMSAHSGIMDYVPEELMLRVRAGTPLAEVQAALSQEGQMLGFEPPDYGGNATIGGVVAAGLSGPRRPSAGSVRDSVLGVTLLTGDATVLGFGGQVMKNVAGYDVSRLMTGAMGTLGVILDVSLKILPRPREEKTWCCPVEPATNASLVERLRRDGLGLSATARLGDKFYVRASGEAQIDGDILGEVESENFWAALANQQLPEFGGKNLWRISVPRTAPDFIEEASVVEWEGALRWLVDPDFDPRQTLTSGHCTLFRCESRTDSRTDSRTESAAHQDRFHPLDLLVGKIHRRLKQQFDPAGVFNPGRVNWYRDAN